MIRVSGSRTPTLTSMGSVSPQAVIGGQRNRRAA